MKVENNNQAIVLKQFRSPNKIQIDGLKQTTDIADSVQVNVDVNIQRTTKLETENSNNLHEIKPEKVIFSQRPVYIQRSRRYIIAGVKIILLLAYLSYVGYCIHVKFGDEGSWRLVICTIIGLIFLARAKLNPLLRSRGQCFDFHIWREGGRLRRALRWCLYVVASAAMITYIGLRVAGGDVKNLISAAGIVVFILILVLISSNRRKINWHTVFWGFAMQFLLAVLILKTDYGTDTVLWISDRFSDIMGYAAPGSEFIFGKNYKSVRMAFVVFPQIMIFTAFINVLMYLGVLKFINVKLGALLSFITEATPTESVSAAANMFLSGQEACLIIYEYLEDLSDPELFCVVVGGLSSLAGGQMIVLAGFGVPLQYIIAASVMSAPAALAASKIVMPNTSELKQRIPTKKKAKKKEKNILQAFANGGRTGLSIATALGVNMIVFFGLKMFLNNTVEWFGTQAGVEGLTLEFILMYVMWPVAFLLGVDYEDCLKVSNAIAVRTLTNVGVAYASFGPIIENKKSYNSYMSSYNDTVFSGSDIYLPQWNMTLTDGILSDRSEVIGVYAMAGTASVLGIGNTVGSFSVLAPALMPTVLRFSMKALLVGTFASFFTACVAGLLL